jgi:hypothetical protein
LAPIAKRVDIGRQDGVLPPWIGITDVNQYPKHCLVLPLSGSAPAKRGGNMTGMPLSNFSSSHLPVIDQIE